MTEFERVKAMNEVDFAIYITKLQEKAIEDFKNGFFPPGIVDTVAMLKQEVKEDAYIKVVRNRGVEKIAELIDKGALAELFEEKMFNIESMCPVIKITDVLEIVEGQPTVNEADIRATVIEEFVEIMKSNLILKYANATPTEQYVAMQVDAWCKEIPEQLKGE